MSFLFSIVSGVAGGIFRAMRDSSNTDAAAKESAVKLTEPGAAPGGTEATGGSFAQKFRAHMAKTVDANGDGVVSRDELAQRLAKGGLSAADATANADKQYKAMDKNGDGQVTVDEYKESLQVPTSPLVQHVLQMIEARRVAAGAGGTAAGATAGTGAARV